MQKAKLQILYIQRHLPPYMKDVHKDDRESGIVTRVWDHPSPNHPVAVMVLPPHAKDLSVDLVVEDVPRIGYVDMSPITVNMKSEADELYISQDTDNIAILDPETAIAIAMRLLVWAQHKQEKAE